MAAPSRTQKRASKVLAEKRQLRSDSVRVPRAALENLHSAQRMFMAIVKEQGRVRVSEKTIETLGEGDRVTFKRDGDHVLLSYVACAVTTEPEGAP